MDHCDKQLTFLLKHSWSRTVVITTENVTVQWVELRASALCMQHNDTILNGMVYTGVIANDTCAYHYIDKVIDRTTEK